MLESERVLGVRSISRYDGQTIYDKDGAIYELGNYLGGGASGSVYQAVDTHNSPTEDDEKTVAVKILNPYLGWLQTRQSVCREMLNMKKIGMHENIVALHEVMELIQDSKSTLFLVLELVTGGELFDRMKISSASADSFARRYFTQLLSGIDYCHEKGVAHRDLKPENLLLSNSSEDALLKIGDFGLSAIVFASEMENELSNADASKISLRRLRSVVGSPHYIAPEVTANGNMGYDGFCVDLWSAGVVLYSLLTGTLPFGGDISTCPRSLAANEDPVLPTWFFPPGMTPLAASLIISLLHTSPGMRISVKDAKKHPWCTQDFTDESRGVYMSPKPSTPVNQRKGNNTATVNPDSLPPSPIKDITEVETFDNKQQKEIVGDDVNEDDMIAKKIEIALESALEEALTTIEIDEVDLLVLNDQLENDDAGKPFHSRSRSKHTSATGQVSNIRSRRDRDHRSSRQIATAENISHKRSTIRERKEAALREAKDSEREKDNQNEKVPSAIESPNKKG
eukprot:GSChrysophyteH1.ASY1.ANO1.570.1 assembled CDS